MKKLNINRFSFNGFVGRITLLSSVVALTSVVLYSCQDQVKEQVQKAEYSTMGERSILQTLITKDRNAHEAMLAVEAQVNFDLVNFAKKTLAAKGRLNQSDFTVTVPVSNGSVSKSSQENALLEIKNKVDEILIDLYGDVEGQAAGVEIINLERATNAGTWAVNVITSIEDNSSLVGPTCECDYRNNNLQFPGYPMNGNKYGDKACVYANGNMTYMFDNVKCKKIPPPPTPGGITGLNSPLYIWDIQYFQNPDMSLAATESEVIYGESNNSQGRYNRLDDDGITGAEQQFIVEHLIDEAQEVAISRGHNYIQVVGGVNATEQVITTNIKTRIYLLLGYSARNDPFPGT